MGGSRPETGPTRPAVRPSGTHTHTRARSRRTHAPARARRQTVRTRRDQSSRMRTGRCGGDGSCSACTRPGPGPSRPARYRRRAVDVGPTRVNQCEDDRRRVALRTVLQPSGVCVCASARFRRSFFFARFFPVGPVKKRAKHRRDIAGHHGRQETVHMVRPGDRTLHQTHHRHGNDQHVGQQEVTYNNNNSN